MIALAPDEDGARELLVRDLEHHLLRVTEVVNEREVFTDAEITDLDEHLAANSLTIEPGSRTVWGTIQCYKGDGEA
jgi:hypothetical protein